MGPLPPSSGFTHLLTIMDRTTRWPEAIPLRDTTTTECARALISTWIARFGVPLDMTSDRGPQFTSAMWSTIASQLGIQLHRTTAYHPQANGLVERFHRTLNASLKARLSSPNWVDELPWVLLGIRVGHGAQMVGNHCSTMTSLHTLNNTATKGFNQMAPTAQTIPQYEQRIPGTIIKLIRNYIKGHKAYTILQTYHHRFSVKKYIPQCIPTYSFCLDIHTKSRQNNLHSFTPLHI